jgi:hypothetical protein
MSLDELRELLIFNNIFLAGHGSKHLELSKMNLDKIHQTKVFMQDISEMMQLLEKFNMTTNIFVYPYTYYDFPCAETILRNNGFNYIFGYKNHMRLSIENIFNGIYNADY